MRELAERINLASESRHTRKGTSDQLVLSRVVLTRCRDNMGENTRAPSHFQYHQSTQLADEAFGVVVENQSC